MQILPGPEIHFQLNDTHLARDTAQQVSPWVAISQCLRPVPPHIDAGTNLDLSDQTSMTIYSCSWGMYLSITRGSGPGRLGGTGTYMIYSMSP